MILNPPLFPELVNLEVNQISLVMPEYYSLSNDSEDPHDIQKTHAIEAGRLRPNLQRMTFGIIAWQRVAGSDTWDMICDSNATDNDVELLPENFTSQQAEWGIEYSEPIDIAELRAFHSKRFPAEHRTD